MPWGCSLITFVIPTSAVVRYFGLVKSLMSTPTVPTLVFYLFGVSFRCWRFAQRTSLPTSCLLKLLVTLNPDKPPKSMFVCTLRTNGCFCKPFPYGFTYKNVQKGIQKNTILYKRINACFGIIQFISVEVIPFFSLHACGSGGLGEVSCRHLRVRISPTTQRQREATLSSSEISSNVQALSLGTTSMATPDRWLSPLAPE